MNFQRNVFRDNKEKISTCDSANMLNLLWTCSVVFILIWKQQ